MAVVVQTTELGSNGIRVDEHKTGVPIGEDASHRFEVLPQECVKGLKSGPVEHEILASHDHVPATLPSERHEPPSPKSGRWVLRQKSRREHVTRS